MFNVVHGRLFKVVLISKHDLVLASNQFKVQIGKTLPKGTTLNMPFAKRKEKMGAFYFKIHPPAIQIYLKMCIHSTRG